MSWHLGLRRVGEINSAFDESEEFSPSGALALENNSAEDSAQGKMP